MRRAAVAAVLVAAVACVALMWPAGAPLEEGQGAGTTLSQLAPPAEPGEPATPPPARGATAGEPNTSPARRHAGVDPQEQLRKQVQAFKASERRDDFSTRAPAGHGPAAMRKLNEALAEWARSPENEAAEVELFGVDCRTPPCVMALQYNTDRGGAFLRRAEKWLKDHSGVGKATEYVHLVDVDHQRVFYFFNPHEAGTQQAHAYQLGALSRIRKRVESLPAYSPYDDE